MCVESNPLSYLTLFLKSITSGCFSAHVVYMLAGMRTFFFFECVHLRKQHQQQQRYKPNHEKIFVGGEEDVFVAQFENYENFKQKIWSFFSTIDGWMVG